jgi:hypothetical protein
MSSALNALILAEQHAPQASSSSLSPLKASGALDGPASRAQLRIYLDEKVR